MEIVYAEAEKRDEFYHEESIFSLKENDEIDNAEAGFMIGYMEA
jgi:hypothetical protein